MGASRAQRRFVGAKGAAGQAPWPLSRVAPAALGWGSFVDQVGLRMLFRQRRGEAWRKREVGRWREASEGGGGGWGEGGQVLPCGPGESPWGTGFELSSQICLRTQHGALSGSLAGPGAGSRRPRGDGRKGRTQPGGQGRGRLHGALQADPGLGRACPQPFCLLPGFPRHPASRQHVRVLEPWPLNCGDVGPPCTLHGEDVPHAEPH